MGLDTSHDCWHGPCSSFNDFRRFLARQIGVNLDDYVGYGGDIEFSTLKHDIKPLLNHSDCDGWLTVPQCISIVKGLNSILDKLNEDTISVEGWFDPLYFKEKIGQFRDGCLKAIGLNEKVRFH